MRARTLPALLIATTAATGLGAGTAAAESDSSGLASHAFDSIDTHRGEQVRLKPSAVDDQIHQAVMLAMPFQSDTANQAKKAWDDLPPIRLGNPDNDYFFPGWDIGTSASQYVSRLPLPKDKVDLVKFHAKNLITLSSGIHVNVHQPKKPAPPPSQPPSTHPTPPPDTGGDVPAPAPPSAPDTPAPPPSTSAPASTPAPTQRASDYGRPPGYSPEQFPVAPRGGFQPGPGVRYGHDVPGYAPEFGILGNAPGPKQAPAPPPPAPRRDDVHDVGRADALPQQHNRSAGPLILAALLLAVTTAGLVRSWMLRRAS